MASKTTLLGCYTYEDQTYLDIFKYFLEKYSPSTELVIANKLADGLYGYTHYLAYLQILNEIETEYVIFTDIRDVVIQRDLDKFPRNELAFFGENNTIGNCPYNSEWMRRHYGEDELKKLSKKQIINCSVVAGTTEKCKQYILDMLEEMDKFSEHINGLDMAVHNHLYYTNKYSARLYSHNAPVFTCGYSDYIRVQRHQILNDYCEVPYIVHQHDRHVSVL